MILGIDEAGRGPWAGPLVVGAVILGGTSIDGLTDSKKLTKKRREALAPLIRERAVSYATGWVSAAELDAIGMSTALQLATIRAVKNIHSPYTEIIIDGTVNFLRQTKKGSYVQTMPKADLLIPSVSAASILAKVERDQYMTRLATEYDGYGFESHAGYGTARHRAAIQERGVIPEHRVSFAPLRQYAQQLGRTIVDGGDSEAIRHLLAKEMGGRQQVGDATSHRGATTKQIGDDGEGLVADELARREHTIIARNWRTRYCEIDIISLYGRTIYFTEVKTRKNDLHGDGFAAITAKKQRQLRFAAELFIAKYPQYTTYNMVLLAASVVHKIVSIIEVD